MSDHGIFSSWPDVESVFFSVPTETANCAQALIALTEYVDAGDPGLDTMIQDAARDRDDGTNGVAIMYRNVQATEMLAKAMRDFRAALLRRSAILKKEVRNGG